MSRKIKAILHIAQTVCLIVFTTIYAQAHAPVVHLSPKPMWLNECKAYDKKIPSRDVENGYFFQLLEEQIQVEKQADYTHVIREIVSGAGIQNGSEISVTFDPSYQTLDFHQITVWRDNKPQNRLSAQSFKIIADEKELSKFIYQGTYSAFCILNDIRKGDRIEYSFTITGRNPILDGHYCRDLYFPAVAAGSAPVLNRYWYRRSASSIFKPFNKVPQVVVSEKNGLKCYSWEGFQVKPADDYDNQPGWYTSYGYVQISDYTNWADVIKWAMKVNPVPGNVKGKLAVEVALLKAQSGNDKEKYFRDAVKLVQDEVRYMGIEMGEYSHRANSPEKVFGQRYGDCKDKSLLLATILNANGIPANLVLISSSAGLHTAQYLPSAYVFDHCVVVATVCGQQVWIDPTIAYERGTGLSLYFPDYGKGLVLNPKGDSLTTITPSHTGAVNCNEKFVINSKGKVILDVTTSYTLNEADRIRDRLASSSTSETEKSYLDYYAKTYPKVEQLDSLTILDNEEKDELTTIEHYLVPDFFKTDSATGKQEASFYAAYISGQLPAIGNKVAYPLALNYPYAINYTISVVLPGGWNVEKSANEVKRDAYLFSSKIDAVNDTLLLNYRFKYLQDFIPVNKLNEYRADEKDIKANYLSYTFTYTPTNGGVPFRLNYWMLFSVLVFVLALGAIGFKIYCIETPEILFEAGANFRPIGGWLIFIAFGLGISTIVILVNLCTGTYFDLNKWNAYTHTRMENGFKAMFTYEALGNVLLMCYALFCLVLLLNRRDILPKFIIGLYLCSAWLFYRRLRHSLGG